MRGSGGSLRQKVVRKLDEKKEFHREAKFLYAGGDRGVIKDLSFSRSMGVIEVVLHAKCKEVSTQC